MKEFDNFKDIMDYYISVVEQGMEGIIVKSKTAPWKNGKPNWAIKIKEEIQPYYSVLFSKFCIE